MDLGLMVFGLLFIGMLTLVLALRLIAGAFDETRITEYVRSQGGQLLEKRWTPFGPGWLGEKNARIYHVSYRDRDGNRREAVCKTSMLAGVYFTEDRIVRPARTDPREQLEMENQQLRLEIVRLREELARLKGA